MSGQTYERHEGRRVERNRTPDPDQRQREEEFWGRYRAVLLAAGVNEGVSVWYQRHCERFIRYVRPKRLRQVDARDVNRFLERLWRGGDWESWQVRQAEDALRKPALGVRSPLDGVGS